MSAHSSAARITCRRDSELDVRDSSLPTNHATAAKATGSWRHRQQPLRSVSSRLPFCTESMAQRMSRSCTKTLIATEKFRVMSVAPVVIRQASSRSGDCLAATAHCRPHKTFVTPRSLLAPAGTLAERLSMLHFGASQRPTPQPPAASSKSPSSARRRGLVAIRRSRPGSDRRSGRRQANPRA